MTFYNCEPYRDDSRKMVVKNEVELMIRRHTPKDQPWFRYSLDPQLQKKISNNIDSEKLAISLIEAMY